MVTEDCRLILGDCLDVIPDLDGVDAVVADPPYGVGFAGKRRSYRNDPQRYSGHTYSGYDDTEENWFDLILPRIKLCIERFPACAFFMSDVRLFDMPRGGNVGGIFMANGLGLGKWGFQTIMHIVYYGKCPYLAANKGCRPNGKNGIYGNDSNLSEHPCAKPVAAMKWLVNRMSFPDQTILDPFMGSGTTGIACLLSDRRFVGIEIDPAYHAIAQKRLAGEQNRYPLFSQTQIAGEQP